MSECPECNTSIGDNHVILDFKHLPAEIEEQNLTEWSECPDGGPSRVAYLREGGWGVTVVVFGGSGGAVYYRPCIVLRRAFGDRWVWVCRVYHGPDICDDSFMREISS